MDSKIAGLLFDMGSREKNELIINHSIRVSIYAEFIAIKSGLSRKEINLIKFAGKVHDIGKVFILDNILLKETSLSNEDKKTMCKHPEVGAILLKDINNIHKDFTKAIKYHHERFDGLGYPSGICGKDIPVGARIISVADTFDAMTSQRTYNTIKTIDEALIVLEELKGNQLDTNFVNIFVDNYKKQEKSLNKKISEEII